jgi:hypothetical protein
LKVGSKSVGALVEMGTCVSDAELGRGLLSVGGVSDVWGASLFFLESVSPTPKATDKTTKKARIKQIVVLERLVQVCMISGRFV